MCHHCDIKRFHGIAGTRRSVVQSCRPIWSTHTPRSASLSMGEMASTLVWPDIVSSPSETCRVSNCGDVPSALAWQRS